MGKLNEFCKGLSRNGKQKSVFSVVLIFLHHEEALFCPFPSTFSLVVSGNYLEWVSKLMIPGSSPRRRKKPL